MRNCNYFLITQNSDAKEIEDSIHSAIRKEVWPKDVTFCCGYFSSNDGDTRVTYTTFVDDCEVLQKINDWRRNTNMLQLGMFLVNLTS